jgi:acetylornithine deacetylase/succinyl-diaminopimelate desuccinylase-like protein
VDLDKHDGGAELRAYVRSRRREIERQLAEWVRVPGVLGDPEHGKDLLRSANWLAGSFRELGFPVVDVQPTGESYAVYAHWCEAPGAPTVLVYSHHDVRTAKPENWDQTAPFEPVVREGRLYGRGSSDAKGQVLAHLEGVRAHLQSLVEPVETKATGVSTGSTSGVSRGSTSGVSTGSTTGVSTGSTTGVSTGSTTGPTGSTSGPAPAVNLKFLVEGEEEGGSPHLAQLLEEQTERFRADVVLFSDTLLWREDYPAICMGLRGMLSAHLEVYGQERDVHSGAVSGNAPNAAFELSRLLAQLHDEDGRIAIPGFYDDVEPLPEELRQALADLPFTEEDWLARSESGAITGEEGYTPLERLWLRPAVEVTSLIASDPIGLQRAAVPAVATASLSFRTVPGQRVEKIAGLLAQWVEATIGGAFRHSLTMDIGTAQEPYRTPDHPAVAALERAMAQGFSADAVGRMGNAGGGPAELLSRSLGVPVLFFGTGLVEDHWHDSDESVSLDVLTNGAVTLACFWDELAMMQRTKDDGDGHLPQ